MAYDPTREADGWWNGMEESDDGDHERKLQSVSYTERNAYKRNRDESQILPFFLPSVSAFFAGNLLCCPQNCVCLIVFFRPLRQRQITFSGFFLPILSHIYTQLLMTRKNNVKYFLPERSALKAHSKRELVRIFGLFSGITIFKSFRGIQPWYHHKVRFSGYSLRPKVEKLVN